MRSINEAFASARDAAGLPEELDLHCLRHSYITHLVEFDYAEKFVGDSLTPVDGVSCPSHGFFPSRVLLLARALRVPSGTAYRLRDNRYAVSLAVVCRSAREGCGSVLLQLGEHGFRVATLAERGHLRVEGLHDRIHARGR